MAGSDREFEEFLADLKRVLLEEAQIPLPELAEENEFVSSLWVGKFLRSRLVFYTAWALAEEIDAKFGEGSWERLAKRISLGIELIHLASLLHDDIMDGDERRRGKECFYRRFGVGSAIVWGDWLFAKGQEVLAELGAGGIGSKAVCVLCEGQLLEEKIRSVDDFSWENYERIVVRKTAELFKLGPEVLVRLGVDSAGAYRDYAFRWGIAFQLVDDLLDWREDLLAKKLCLPVVLLKEIGGVEVLNRIWQRGDLTVVPQKDLIKLAGERITALVDGDVPKGLEWFRDWIYQKLSQV